MKILYFSGSYTTHDRQFLARFVEAGMHPTYARLSGGPVLELRPPPPGIRTIELESEAGLNKILSELEPELVYAGPVPSCAYYAALTGFRPLVVMSWGSDILLDGNPRHTDRIRTALTAADLFVCDCQGVLHKARAIAGDALADSLVIPWGTDLVAFRPPVAKCAPPHNPEWRNHFVVFSNRSWTRIHGAGVALEAFYKAWQRRADLRLVLAGDGPDEGAIHSFVAKHRLAEVVHMPGRIAAGELAGWYEAADLYLSCSVVDGSSVSLLEAMACGLPVLVSDIEGNREWIEPGWSGWLAASPESFAEGMLRAASSALLRRGVGAAARRTAEQRADWRRNSVQLIDLLRSLVPVGCSQ